MKELLQLVADTQKKLSEYGKDVKSGPSWSWVMDRSLALFKEYPSGLTLAILHSELEWQWNKVRQSGSGDWMSLDAVYQGKSTCSKIVKANIQNVDADKGTLALSDISNPLCTLSTYIDSRFKVLFPTEILVNASVQMINVRAIKDHKGTRLVSTPSTLFTLKDPAFVSTYLTSKLDHVSPEKLRNGVEFRFLLQIESIVPIGSIYEMVLRETATQRMARFVFKNQDASIVKLLKEGQSIGVWNPVIEVATNGSDLTFYMGPDTFFLGIYDATQSPSKQKMHVAEGLIHPVPIDEMGQLDFKAYPSRILISNLNANATNASIFVKVDAVSPNAPLEEEDGTVSDRFVVQISDESGAQCITFWDDLGREVSSVQVGMWMLVTNVSVFSHDAFFYLSARQDTRSKFQIVNTLTGLLTSPFASTPSLIMDAIADEEATFIAHGHIKELIANPKGSYTEVYHVTCKRPIESLLEEGGWFCPMCRVKARERDTYFSFSAVLDDGSLPLSVELHWKVAEELLGLSAHRFIDMLPCQQKALFESRLKVPLMASISRTHGACYRMDAASLL